MSQQQTKKNKEIKISMGIGTHDLETKKRNLIKLANKGHLVKLTLQIKGRHRSRPGDASAFFKGVLDSMDDDIGPAGSIAVNNTAISLMVKAKNPPKRNDDD